MFDWFTFVERWDQRITRWLAAYSLDAMRIGLGVVFF